MLTKLIACTKSESLAAPTFNCVKSPKWLDIVLDFVTKVDTGSVKFIIVLAI